MTIIWAKKIEWKRNLFADDCICIWDTKASASKNYRKKIRKLPRTTNNVLCASAWTCRETDYMVNLLDKKLCEKLYYTELELLDLIQDIIVEWCKTLKEIDEDNPHISLILLDATLGACYLIEEFSVKLLTDDIECVCWCWQDLFYKIHARESSYTWDEKFIKDMIFTADLADWCSLPLFITDWEKESEVNKNPLN